MAVQNDIRVFVFSKKNKGDGVGGWERSQVEIRQKLRKIQRENPLVACIPGLEYRESFYGHLGLSNPLRGLGLCKGVWDGGDSHQFSPEGQALSELRKDRSCLLWG